METTPVKSPVTYKRRRSGRPLSELLWNASDVDVDPESAVYLLVSDAEGIENVTPAKKNRKRWSDQPLARRQTRSSTTPGVELTALKDRAVRASGTHTSKKTDEKESEKGKDVERSPTKDKENVKGKGIERTARKDIERTPRKDTKKDRGKGVERTPTPSKHTPREHASKESPAGDGPGLWHSPIEFVIEKRAMFAEIDAFELESEEEEPDQMKTTGIEMLSTSSGEAISLESSKGETSVEPPDMRPEQSTQNATSTEELSKGETSVSPNSRLEHSTRNPTNTEERRKGESSVPIISSLQSTQVETTDEAVIRGERAVQIPTMRLDQNKEEVPITTDVGENDDG